MSRAIVYDGFVDTTVKREVVLIVSETELGEVNGLFANLSVDARSDGCACDCSYFETFLVENGVFEARLRQKLEKIGSGHFASWK